MATGFFNAQAGQTPESVERRRRIADALLAQAVGRTPKNIGEGLSAIGAALGYRGLSKKMDKEAASGREKITAALGSMFGGQRQPAIPDSTLQEPPQPQVQPMGGAPQPMGGVSSDLVKAVIGQESGGNPQAVSPKGAAGLMQVMPETAADPGFGVEPMDWNQRFDPQANQRFGEDYLGAMLDRYGGDTTRALVAYNWGPGNADKWDGSMESLPEETRNYVQSITSQMGQGGQPTASMTAEPDQQMVQAGGSMTDALAVLDSPYASQGQKALASAWLEQQMKQAQGPDPTSGMREYEYARQNGFQGSFIDFLEARKGGVNVNIGGGPELGKLSTDYGYILDPETREPVIDPTTGLPKAAPVPGSKADVEQQEIKEKAQRRQVEIQRAGGTVVQDLGRGLELLPELSQGEGVVGANMRLAKAALPGTPEYQVDQFIQSALSNVGLDRLQQMRDSSPTGGALGQVPIQQQQRLEQVLGSLKLGAPLEVLEANMQRIMNIYFDIMYGSPEERAQAVQSGKLPKEQADYYDSLYFDLPFDEVGRPKNQGGRLRYNPETGDLEPVQ